MDIIVDENIPLLSVEQLRRAGHDVLDIRGTAREGITDEELWSKACADKRLLITTDRGFAYYRDKNLYGILVISLRKLNCSKINKRIIEALKQFPPGQWRGLLVVMRDEAVSTWRMGKNE